MLIYHTRIHIKLNLKKYSKNFIKLKELYTEITF